MMPLCLRIIKSELQIIVFVNTLILCSSAKYMYTSSYIVVISKMITFIFLSTVGKRCLKTLKSERLTGEVTKQKMCMLHFCISLRISKHMILKWCKVHMKTIVRKHYQVLWCQHLIPCECGGYFIHFLISVVCYQEMFTCIA